MSQNEQADELMRKRAEKAIEMVFDGVRCKIIPLPSFAFVQSGRMPDYLTRVQFGPADGPEPKLTPEQIIEGEQFKRHAVCKMLVEPRLIPSGEPKEGERLYADFAEDEPRAVSQIFVWMMQGCPKPAEEKGEGVLGAEDLKTFPAGDGRRKRARAGGGRKGKRVQAVAPSAAD